MGASVKVEAINFNAEEAVNKIYTACRTCYSEYTPSELYLQSETLTGLDNVKKWKLIKHVIDSGHHSTLEHVSFTFLVSGVSRALLAQLTRHRFISFSVQSQRYCQFDNGFQYVTPKSIEQSGAKWIYAETMEYLQNAYKKLLEQGIPAEDARMVLPNACCTNVTMTMNIRELIHFCHERLCTCAQWEIRQMAKEMAGLIYSAIPELKQYLQPKCKALGYCPESKDRCCGRMPLKKDAIQNNYVVS